MLHRSLIPGLLVAAIVFLADSLYIDAKAELAQILIQRAFERSIRQETPVKPWEWADTWPVARLVSQPQGIDTYVLSGAQGSALAFGPGHIDGTDSPGGKGTSVIAGHRDTHFGFLRELAPGDGIEVQDSAGQWSYWVVDAIEVIDTSERPTLTIEPGAQALYLVTCYPFDAVSPGGDLRYVVTARAAAPEPPHALPSALLRYPTSSSD